MELALQAGNAAGLQMHVDRKRGRAVNAQGLEACRPETYMAPNRACAVTCEDGQRVIRANSRRHPLRSRPVRPVPSARDAIPGPRPERRFRPERPVLSFAPATRRPVVHDRRVRVRIRINAGTQGDDASGTHDLAFHARLMELALQAGNAAGPQMHVDRKRGRAVNAQGPEA
jgi:hypothetical protein